MKFNPLYVHILTLFTCVLVSPNHALFAQNLRLQSNLVTTGENVIKNAYGFNAAFMYNEATEEINNRTVLKSEIIPILDELAPNLLRFPGGTIANYYHYYRSGYGVNSNELPFGVIAKQIFEDTKYSQNFIHPFIETAKESNCEVLYVLNLRSHFFPINFQGYQFNPNTPRFKDLFKQNMDAIEHLMSENVNVVGIELGNEHFFDAIMTRGMENDSLRGLMELSKMYTDSIKHYWPGMPVSVPIPKNTENGFYRLYVESTLKYDFYDAVSIHIYLTSIQNDCSIDLDAWDYFECSEVKADDYLFENFDYLENEYFPYIQSKGKKVWLTEWNINEPQRVGNTFFQASYVFRFLNELIKLNSKFDNIIEHVNFHSFISPGSAYPVVGPFSGYKEVDSLDVYNGFSIKASKYALDLFKDLSNNNFKNVDGIIANEDGQSNPLFNSWTYYDATVKRYKWMFYNNSTDEVSIDLSLMKFNSGTNEMIVNDVTMNYFYAEDRYNFAGVAYDNLQIDDKIGNQLKVKENIAVLPNAIITIPKFTIGSIDILLEENNFRASGIDTFYATEAECKHQLNFQPFYEGGNLTYRLSRLNAQNGLFEIIEEIFVLEENEDPQSYQIEIDDPFQGLNEYKIEVIQNGTLLQEESTSLEMSCIINSEVDLDVQVNPTITVDMIKVIVETSGFSHAQISISNLSSGPIFEENVILNPGVNNFTYSMTSLANSVSGYYNLSVITGNKSVSDLFLYFP